MINQLRTSRVPVEQFTTWLGFDSWDRCISRGLPASMFPFMYNNGMRIFQSPGLVADGRDMGTVIFPEAQYKVFLTASAEERAKRRYKQLKDKGVSVNLDSLLHEIAARDERDAGRAVAPLKPAEDAVILDTTGMPITEVIERVLALLPVSLRPR